LGKIPIHLQDSIIAGYLFLDLAVKESTGETVYPELLQPRTLKTNLDNASYSYAVYANKKLLTQTNDYTFPVFMNERIQGDHQFVTRNEKSELWYRADKNKVVVVVQNQKLWLESITLFSYLFGIQVLVAILIVLYKSSISYFAKPKLNGKIINFTLRRRIHLSMLSIVLVSFLIIGIITIVYFTFQYKQNTREKLLSVMQVVERSVNQYLEQENALSDPALFNRVTNTAAFKYFITNLANAQKTDINVFNASGILNVTSQDNIYDRALLARIMRQDAYHALWVNKKSLLMQDENIGKLSHLSCYVPVRDEAGVVMGFINIPYFASQKELNYQISNILVALINLYAFVFLLSGILTVFITRWITRSFNIVISQFEKLNLSKNELIEWPYEDEIGLLVDEYNKMVKKVEANAMMMARNERESAWREMAKQVAHEIKNPLTPMKLNIQYLQQALRNDYDNVRELTVKVSESLIEQIDNLSYIASEFSNFAKMPEAIPENIEVNELTERVAELYLNESEVKVEILKSTEPIYINADRSQLLRVFTNLLQNAVQSIPQGRDGLVNISIKADKGDVVIAFADNGTGISSDIVDKIFQPYFTTKTSGTGLGLAMTRKIIEFWKGKIWFDTTEDKGTTFYVRMPMTEEV
jgi:signal transduction histidine kinase